MSNDGVQTDNLKEYTAQFSMFLGQEFWANLPLFCYMMIGQVIVSDLRIFYLRKTCQNY
ncbi:unnamed protein product [Paramecium octaurelia]|uniref:Uncharacterized protein n=1 Tax=Paramecium octaurelia TaxID=43137 RepID=A0A8S1VRQ3_PAROT|nr:unnamed protein product [Paramecium octaurelia]